MEDPILNGLRVLDFTRILAGPYTTRLLADFGAEVIKIQSGKTAQGAESNRSNYFCALNRNKKSITLNMTHSESKEIFLKLIRISDVLVENFSPRVMSNWGLNYDHLKPINSNLIMLSMSAMGQTGPWKDFVAYGPTLQSLSGLTYLTSFSEHEPMGIGYAYSDIIAGLYGAVAVLSALHYRRKNGHGEYIDLSQYEAICTTLGPTLMDFMDRHKEILPGGFDVEYPRAAPYGCYPCSGENRWCVIAVHSEEEWGSFCRVMGDPAWAKENKFCSLSKRMAHKIVLNEHIRNWTATHDASDIVEGLQAAGVPAGVVQNAEDLDRDSHLAARHFFSKINHPVHGEMRMDTHPIRLSEQPEAHWKPAPSLGEDNDYVFKTLLGLSENELGALKKRGVVG
ncbi:MAG: CoA transferase [Pseudomonadota bacterium]